MKTVTDNYRISYWSEYTDEDGRVRRSASQRNTPETTHVTLTMDGVYSNSHRFDFPATDQGYYQLQNLELILGEMYKRGHQDRQEIIRNAIGA